MTRRHADSLKHWGTWSRPRRAGLSSLLIFGVVLGALLFPASAQAYVGPGAGFAFVTSFFLLLSTLLLVIAALVTWPARMLYRLFTRKRRSHAPHVKRVVIVGLDGMDPRVTRELLAQNKLPNFKRIAEAGSFGELATTCPAISPVAWSTFATGVDPSKHGIFDFLAPDRQRYGLRLSSTDIRPPRRMLSVGPWEIPLGKPSIRSLRRAVPWWSVLADHGVRSSVIRVPITYPPDNFDGAMLSAMCAPDLLGTQGSFTYFTSEQEGEDRIGGRVVRVQVDGDEVRTNLPGPPHPLRKDKRQLNLPLRLKLDRKKGTAHLTAGRQKVTLEVGKYSEWTELRFSAGPALGVHGIGRFRLLSVDPFRLYLTPMNIDPVKPLAPVSHPFYFSVFLAKLMGRFSTLGLAEDTWALNEGVLDEAGFLEQVDLFQQEREQMLMEMLGRTKAGVLAVVFDATDRIQHMFMADHGKPERPNAGAVEQVYLEMDAMLGRLLKRLDLRDKETMLMVMSDHGFAPFERGVNLNTWLQEKGYLALKQGQETMGEYLQGVDWDRTKAYALGLSGLYLNLQGREARGTVSREEAPAFRAKLKAELEALRDGERDDFVAIPRVFDTRELYRGPFMDDAPDLLIGYNRGYRASWDTARGMGGPEVIEDNTRHWTGDHCMDPELVPGVLFTSQGVQIQGASMIDIAPTVLDLMGVEKPMNMTGRSLVKEAS